MARVQDYVMAFDPAAKNQIDHLKSQHDLFVSHATSESKIPHLLHELRKRCAEFRSEYTKQNWREPFLKTFKHPKDCNMVNYPSWNHHRYKGDGEQDIYVYATFAPPGKHTLLIKDCVLKEFDQIYFLKTVVGLKEIDHVPRQHKDAFQPMKPLETMPRNMRKFPRMKIMKMFQVDEHRENIFPDLQTVI